MSKDGKTDAFSLSGVRIGGYVDRIATAGQLCEGKRTLALYIAGVDSTFEDLAVLRTRHNLDLTSLDASVVTTEGTPDGPFEVVFLGNVIEHLSNPGLVLDELMRCMTDDGQLIVTCPNAFGGPNFARFLLGRYREGPDHVQSYTKYTLANLLVRHGFQLDQAWTGIDQPPRTTARRFGVILGGHVLRRFPNLGGTLILTARPKP